MKFIDLISDYNSKIKYNLNFEHINNVIIYSGSNNSNYKESLLLIKNYSKSKLNYDKKITIEFNNTEYIYRISDIHIEIDFTFLGCVAKQLWDKIFEQIKLIINLKKNFFVICKNFNNINNDLLEIFYIYMNYNKIKYIFLTNAISFIPDNILNCSNIISIKNRDNTILMNASLEKIKKIINTKNQNIELIRNILYEILIYQIDPYSFLYQVIKYVFTNFQICDNKKNKLLNDLNISLKYFNNNYRSIYHLEYWIISIIDVINNI